MASPSTTQYAYQLREDVKVKKKSLWTVIIQEIFSGLISHENSRILSIRNINYHNQSHTHLRPQQVSHWEEALVEAEYQAKQTAQVLFFVLDPATRNVSSMVEAAYMAGGRRYGRGRGFILG